MLKARDIIGMPIIEVTTGRQLGQVKDFYLDGGWELKAILLEGKHWFSPAKVIPCRHVLSFGTDAVTVDREESVEWIEPESDWTSFMNGKLKGLPMLTVNGHQLGFIEDVYFSEDMEKKVTGFELTEGFISDLTEGRRWLPAPDRMTLGEDAIIVPLNSDMNLEEIGTSIRE